MSNLYNDYEYVLTNREKTMKSKRVSIWCPFCDTTKIQLGSKCPICRKKVKTKRDK